MLEELKWYDFANVYQVPGNCNSNLHKFIHSQTLYFRHDEALTQSLTHILGEFV